MIGYGITEDELDHLGILNTQASAYFSVCSSLTALGIGLWFSYVIEGQPTTTGKLLADAGTPACLIFAVVFLGLAIHAVRARGTIISRIKKQSKEIKQQ